MSKVSGEWEIIKGCGFLASFYFIIRSNFICLFGIKDGLVSWKQSPSLIWKLGVTFLSTSVCCYSYFLFIFILAFLSSSRFLCSNSSFVKVLFLLLLDSIFNFNLSSTCNLFYVVWTSIWLDRGSEKSSMTAYPWIVGGFTGWVEEEGQGIFEDGPSLSSAGYLYLSYSFLRGKDGRRGFFSILLGIRFGDFVSTFLSQRSSSPICDMLSS